MNVIEILKRISKIKSPSGFEGAMAEEISKIAAENGISCRKDALGNVVLHRAGKEKRCLIDCHIDTTGFLATYIDEGGFIRFGALGGLSVSDIQNIPVEFLNGTRGVVSYEQKTELKDRKITSLFIDIGAKDKESAEKCVLPGDAAVYYGSLCELSDGRISAPYLDNRIGVACVLYAMINLSSCKYDVTAAFSVQEEVGCRGAKTAAYESEADFAIVLDVTDAGETPSYNGCTDIKLGCGAAIKIMDTEAISHPEIVRAINETADKEKIAHLPDVVTAGGTDAGNISLSRGGIPTGGISVPVRYMHSPCEVADASDIESAAALLLAVLEENAIKL